ncbi:MAG: TIGR04283 family arsenosugar biosynthesis glycosyltransferase [Gammaproteobacteria bacterium]|jgi:rSAM/selenodomain-associated transferase 2|nr:glycosyl transferase family 2 [Chromatiales bacterium]MDP6674845.1 TIGR04283 family arsenosugar biosynthesis glycosyltransferase [Gammaproteobacteria bacterium]
MTPVHDISISIVIPVLGDTPALSALLETLQSLDNEPHETIIVDGANDPSVTACCQRYGCINLNARPGRGHQLHTGALRASGDVIWFLHADAEPPHEGIEFIRRALRAGAIGGSFRFRFTGRPAWYKSMLAKLINVRCRFGTPYGDQGIFIRNTTYIQSGGFPDTALFEEVPLVRTARSAGRFVSLDAPIGVSPRRWERDGWIRRTLGNRLLAIGYMLGLSPDILVRYYRFATHKEQPEC